MHRMQLLSKFIEIYFPDTTQGCSNHDQSPASWAHILPEITVSNSACNTSLAALCTAQLGLWNYDALLGKKGSQIYGSSLGELRKAIRSIGCRKLVTPEATIASIVILSTYDVSLFAARSINKSNLVLYSSSQDHRDRILCAYTFGVRHVSYSFLEQASVKLRLAVYYFRKYELLA